METTARVDERLFVALARRSSRARRIELRSPWAFCVSETIRTAFHVVLEGACWLCPAGSPPLRLEPGDLVLLPHGARHMLVDDPSMPPLEMPSSRAPAPDHICEDGDGRRSVLLSGGYRSKRPLPILASLREAIQIPADRCDRHGLRAIVDLLDVELEKDRPGAATIVPALTNALLPLVARAWLDDCMAGPRKETSEMFSDPAIKDALGRIHEEPERDWTVIALAREVALSRSAFAHRFARAVGAPPAAYLAHWRMTIAGNLLRDTDLKLAAVASRVGYTSEFAFAKAFKRDHGIAPGAYRRRPP
jgi:AraC-like DNA-binding protein